MNALRGAIVVVIALVIAVVILARGLDEPETTNVPAETTDTTEASTQPADTSPPPPDTEAPDDPPPPADTAPAPAPAPASEEVELPPAAPEEMFDDPPPPPPPTRSPDQVRVLVANGTDTCGAAGRLATALSAQGFNVLPAVNADISAEISAVYYVEEYGADAGIVASKIQVDLSQVLPMPASPPTAPGDAHVVVHIGADDLAQPNC
ncbi:MAG: LytR C-terminal domain-containing protein [bacterium]|nr:LytR C-terminal domain-containing protein [bacterium]